MPTPATWRNVLLVLLSLAAGCVDAVGFLGFGEVFVANMTGNTVLLGIAIGQGDGQAALRAGTALAGFICGVAAGAVVVGRKRERGVWPKAVTAALAVELAVLISFAGGWLFAGSEPSRAITLLLISLSSLAMGVQSSAVRRLGVPGVATTYITGTLTNLTEGAIDWLRTFRSLKTTGGNGEEQPEPAQPSARGLLLPADVWLAYGAGAVAGGAAQLLWWPMAVLFPAGIVAMV
ncbi:MAG: YoaK family protein, partial [Rubrobacteraceae bacterium]